METEFQICNNENQQAVIFRYFVADAKYYSKEL